MRKPAGGVTGGAKFVLSGLYAEVCADTGVDSFVEECGCPPYEIYTMQIECQRKNPYEINTRPKTPEYKWTQCQPI
jgi:hypothetical protein